MKRNGLAILELRPEVPESHSSGRKREEDLMQLPGCLVYPTNRPPIQSEANSLQSDNIVIVTILFTNLIEPNTMCQTWCQVIHKHSSGLIQYSLN